MLEPDLKEKREERKTSLSSAKIIEPQSYN